MKVALVCPYDLGRHGGVQNQVGELAAWLRESGHEALIVGPGESGPLGSVLLGPARLVPANGAATPIRLDPRVAGRVADAVAACDVVHVHEPLMPAVSLGAMMRAAPPIVATLHADPPPAVLRLYRIGNRIVRRVICRAPVVTAVSPIAARVLPGVPVRIIPNGIDVASYPTVERRPQQVAFVGRDDPRKGLRTLLQAWPDVRRTIPDATLQVVGTDEVSGRSPGVSFLGRVDEDTKRAVLASSGVFCAPNTGGESFGIILVEAMAAGCAVVASAIPGFVFAAGDAALLVSPNDSAGLAASLIAILADGDRRGDLQQAGKERVQLFDRDTVLGAYLQAYRDALVTDAN